MRRGSSVKEVEPGIRVLADMARRGEIDPWDVDIVQVTDRYLAACEALDPKTLADSGSIILCAAILFHLKAKILAEHGSIEESAEAELEMPAHMHLGARPLTKGLESQMMISICVNKMAMAEPISSMIFSGVFERHPGFRLVSVEAGVGWMGGGDGGDHPVGRDAQPRHAIGWRTAMNDEGLGQASCDRISLGECFEDIHISNLSQENRVDKIFC